MIAYKVRCIKHYENVTNGPNYDEYIAFYEGEIYNLEIEDNEYYVYSTNDEDRLSEESWFKSIELLNRYFIIDIRETRKQKLNIINKI